LRNRLLKNEEGSKRKRKRPRRAWSLSEYIRGGCQDKQIQSYSVAMSDRVVERECVAPANIQLPTMKSIANTGGEMI
jgi:hypothetical protein